MANWCEWFEGQDALWSEYHDKEWGRPVHDDRKLFEYLLMECMSCGLSWGLMMRKQEIFRTVFAEYDFRRVAAFSEEDIDKAAATEGMIHSRRKVAGIVNNARRILEVIREFGSFDNYVWSFTRGKAVRYPENADGVVLTRSPLSDTVAKDMKRRGFKYVGTVIIYSYLQGIGVINDHHKDCPLSKNLDSTEQSVQGME